MEEEICNEGATGKSGTLLITVFCKKCESRHQQWKFPCTNKCDHGRISIEPLGYKICPICEGRGYINEEKVPHCKECGGDYPGSCYACD